MSKKIAQDNAVAQFNFKSGIDSEFMEHTDVDDVANKEYVVVGNYAVIQFSTKRKLVKFVGLVQSVDDDEVEVLFLHKQSKKAYVRPAKDNKSWVSHGDILQILSPPTINNQEHYIFDETLDTQ